MKSKFMENFGKRKVRMVRLKKGERIIVTKIINLRLFVKRIDKKINFIKEVVMQEYTAFISVIIAFLVIVIASALRILRGHERAVVFRLGRLIATKGPGINIPDSDSG
ncbi:MAG: hypothetical protein MZV64_36620 [Ignavibacteriales bacterium]|nr:hypothetical protein [Ignavibacteriales bacterium]